VVFDIDQGRRTFRTINMHLCNILYTMMISEEIFISFKYFVHLNMYKRIFIQAWFYFLTLRGTYS